MLSELTQDGKFQSMASRNYEILYDSIENGICQFSSVVFAWRDSGFLRSTDTFRSYLDLPNFSSDVYHLELFVTIPLNQYLTERSHDGTYGHTITQRAMTRIFNIEIIIFSQFLDRRKHISVKPGLRHVA